MNEILALLSLVALAVVAAAAVFFLRRRPRKLNTGYFTRRWKEVQELCGDKTTWKQAIIEADELLAEALRRKGVRGKSTGERLVKIQRDLTTNDATWYGHKLRRQLDAEPKKRLREKEVKDSLVGIRQALKDIGALANGSK